MSIAECRSLGMETVAGIIIDDAEACAFLDSGATADLMTLAYAEARNFDIRLMTELSDHFINLRLAAGFKTTLSGYVEYNLQILGISYDSDQVALAMPLAKSPLSLKRNGRPQTEQSS